MLTFAAVSSQVCNRYERDPRQLEVPLLAAHCNLGLRRDRQAYQRVAQSRLSCDTGLLVCVFQEPEVKDTSVVA
jgi:hypothetical protein